MLDKDKIIKNIQQEMKRGTLVLAVLSKTEEPQYGYSLIEDLNRYGIEIEQNTLYPLLRRLENQGLLISDWDTEGNRPRKYYQISEIGKEIRTSIIKDWKNLNNNILNILEVLK